MAQDVSDQFLQTDINLLDWMGDHRQPGDDDQSIRSVLGRLLFSADDLPKAPKVLSGGEKNRMTFGRLMLGRHNVMLLDEPTNHLDMESIESLQFALEKYEMCIRDRCWPASSPTRPAPSGSNWAMTTASSCTCSTCRTRRTGCAWCRTATSAP